MDFWLFRPREEIAWAGRHILAFEAMHRVAINPDWFEMHLPLSDVFFWG